MAIEENKQLVMEGYRLFQSGEIGRLLELYHDDAEWIGPEAESVPFAGSYRGKHAIAQFFAALDASTHVNRFEPTQFIAEGDTVVVTGLSSWQAKSTGRSYDSDWVHVFTMRDGKVARFQTYHDTAASEKAFRPAQGSQASIGSTLHH